MATGSPTTAHTWSVDAAMGWDTSTGDMAEDDTNADGPAVDPSPPPVALEPARLPCRVAVTVPDPNLPKIPLLVSAIAKGVRPPWWIGEWERTARSWPTDSQGARLPRCSPPAGCARRRSARSSCPVTTAPSGVPSTSAPAPPSGPTTPPPGSGAGPGAPRRARRRPTGAASRGSRRTADGRLDRRTAPVRPAPFPRNPDRRWSPSLRDPSVHCAHVEQNGEAMTRHLEGTVALVTGASSGIGEATAVALAAEGATVSHRRPAPRPPGAGGGAPRCRRRRAGGRDRHHRRGRGPGHGGGHRPRVRPAGHRHQQRRGHAARADRGRTGGGVASDGRAESARACSTRPTPPSRTCWRRRTRAPGGWPTSST